jgi:hypothetical protein
MELTAYAKQINELHNLIEVQMKTPIKTAIEIGQILSEVKENVGHGNFLNWIENNCSFNRITAFRYVKMFTNVSQLNICGSIQEAYKKIEQIEYKEKQTEEQRKNGIINQYIKTGKKPDGWDRSLDYEYQKRLKSEKEYQERMEEIRLETEQRQTEKSKTEQEAKEKDEYFENLTEEAMRYADEISKREQARNNLNSKVKDLTTLYDVIESYVDGLDISKKLECYHNLIKFCKNKANELQVKSIN